MRTVSMSREAMQADMYGDNSDFMEQYLETQLYDAERRGGFSSRVREAVDRSLNYVRDLAIRYSIGKELRDAHVGDYITENQFHYCDTVDELRGASLTMQRFIIAEPTMSKLYREQNIDGYSNTYAQEEMGDRDDNGNYRLVMSGVLQSEEEQGYIKYYLEDEDDYNKPLKPYEKAIVLDTWDSILHSVNTRMTDFTNQSDHSAIMNRN